MKIEHFKDAQGQHVHNYFVVHTKKDPLVQHSLLIAHEAVLVKKEWINGNCKTVIDALYFFWDSDTKRNVQHFLGLTAEQISFRVETRTFKLSYFADPNRVATLIAI